MRKIKEIRYLGKIYPVKYVKSSHSGGGGFSDRKDCIEIDERGILSACDDAAIAMMKYTSKPNSVAVIYEDDEIDKQVNGVYYKTKCEKCSNNEICKYKGCIVTDIVRSLNDFSDNPFNITVDCKFYR